MTPEERQPIVIRFNPWWFAGPENLLRQFLGAFRAGLHQDSRLVEVFLEIGKYVDALSPLVALVPGVGSMAEKSLTAARALAQSPDQLRDRIDRELKSSPRQILVIIDDIDRLPEQEIREMLKLVKSVANFPKTVYLMAFDKNAVTSALEGPQKGRGEEYLRKIVQLEIDVPAPDPIILRHLLRLGLERLLGPAIEVLRDSEDWENAYQHGFRHYLQTLRDVKRYLNAVSVTYPFVANEVHPFDFLTVEILRISLPSIYDVIRQNKERFTGGDSDWDQATGGGTPQERRPFYDRMIGQVTDRLQAPLVVLLRRLFPKFDASYGGLPRASDLGDEWRRDRRICSPDVFPVYFQLGIPVGEISAAVFRTICQLANDRQRFAHELRTLALSSQPSEVPGSRLMSFLVRLADHPGEIARSASPGNLDTCIGALYDVGDPIYLDAWEKLEVSEIDDLIVTVIGELLAEGVELSHDVAWLAQLGRFDHIRDGITTTSSLYVPVLHVSRLVRHLSSLERARRRAGTPAAAAVSPDRLEELKRLICEKIQQAAQDMTLARTPRLLYTLNAWQALCPDGVINRGGFVQRLLQTDEGFGRLLGAHLHQSVVETGPDDPGRVRYTVDLRELSKDLGDRDAVNSQYERAVFMATEHGEWMTPRVHLAIETFCETWRRAGSRIPDASGN